MDSYHRWWLIVIILVVTVAGSVKFLNNKQNSVKIATPVVPDLGFCDKKLQDTTNKRSKMSPSLFIKQNKYSKELELWKKALMNKHQWDEVFFDSHIRIITIEPYTSKDTGEVINPQYSFLIDWASFDIGGDVITVGKGEVIKLVVNRFPSVENIISCDEAVSNLKKYHASLNPEYISLNDTSFFLEGYSGGYSGSLRGCQVAEVSLTTGEIIQGKIDGPCRIN